MAKSFGVVGWPTTQWRELPLEAGQVGLWWIGQGGFAARFGERGLLIDPYLSNSLWEKYRDGEFPHVRMTPPPIASDRIEALDWVFCSHRHGDHMDPGTLPALGEGTACRFFVPAAAREHVIEGMGLPADRVTGMNAGQTIQLDSDVRVTAVPAAHEQLAVNERGEHRYLGFVLDFAGLTVYHSGDCCPYESLAAELRPLEIDVALLPVNGRDEYRTSRGILGNFHVEEAVALCDELYIPRMIAHHFGMFDFNTVPPAELAERIAACRANVAVCIPEIDRAIVLGG